jgi:LPXTG-motif cell wall-anchored protein
MRVAMLEVRRDRSLWSAPMPSRRLAALATALALALPGAAFGQSAGDEQYQDPFAGDDQEQSGGGSGNAPAPTATAVPTPAPEAGTAATPSAGGSASSGGGGRHVLPYTGADAGALLLAGAVLLGGGVALRVRLRER